MDPAPTLLAPTPLTATPAAVCDFVLGAAIAADADVVWIEPSRGAGDTYGVDIERHGRLIASLNWRPTTRARGGRRMHGAIQATGRI